MLRWCPVGWGIGKWPTGCNVVKIIVIGVSFLVPHCFAGLVQRIFSHNKIQDTRSPLYFVIYGSYKLLINGPVFFRGPLSISSKFCYREIGSERRQTSTKLWKCLENVRWYGSRDGWQSVDLCGESTSCKHIITHNNSNVNNKQILATD